MLQIIEKRDLHQYVEDMYAIAIKAEQAAYPFWGDGLKTKDEFLEMIQKFEKEKPNCEWVRLLYLEEGKPEGYILYEWMLEDNYINFDCFAVKGDYGQALCEVMDYVKEHHSGANVHLGISEKNTKAVEYFTKNNWEILDKLKVNVFHFREDTVFDVSEEVIPVTIENFEDFRKIHGKIEGEMYWNSARLLEELKKDTGWKIFLWEEDGEPVAEICNWTGKNQDAEIFCSSEIKPCPKGRKELLKAALQAARESGAKYNWFFTEGGEEQQLVEEVGFTFLDDYVCFERTF